MNQDTIFYGSAPNQPPVQNVVTVVGSSSNSVVSNSSNFGSVNSLPQNFVVVSNAACSCTSNYGDMTCGSPDCINKFQQNPVHIGHQQPQQVTTTSNSQILTYTLPTQTVVVDKSEDDEMLHELAMAAQGHDIGSHHEIKDSDGQPIDDKEARRLRVAELARQRYQNMSAEEKKAVNSRRMLLRKRKRQREREMEELEAILRATNDIEEDVVFIGEIREKKQRESRAKAARSRYQNMNPEERKNYNQKRRLRQLSLLEGTESAEAEQLRQQIQAQNARKAELARQRYHRMSIDERKTYNKRRTESLRRRRVEEEALLATPAGQIDAESLARAQQIMLRNAMRAEKARQRYNANSKRKSHEGTHEKKRSKSTKSEQQGALKNEADDGDILTAIERDVVRRTQEAKQVLEQRANPQSVYIKRENLPINEVINVCPVMNTAPVQGQTTFAPIQVHSGGPGETKPTTKYVSYMQLPAGTTQSGFLLADGQFVALQPALHPQEHTIHTYPIEQSQPGFDNNFHHINQAAVLRSSNAPQGPIIIQTGQRVELIQQPPDQSGYHHPPNSIHVVNYSHQPQQQASHNAQTHAPPPPQQSSGTPQYAHQQVQRQHSTASTVDEKVLRQKAKRAERARKRYHEMSAEARHEFNAKRALALKMSRMKDEELCRLGDEIDITNAEVDDVLRASIEQARIRRARRAESARQKYQKMTPNQRREHNAMRDAQRRQRKREQEEAK
ncbi:hypothetical protein DdX_01394 [Ditylenchus destructor]|uniref:Uncharacterized protein n=1 Tax=Ditylenchus destructor TaxID=166010 RepID=A0AAD4RDU9_9BILA|nr:hypothetical protein DdX_01394 [Ditylenchus destructor]